MTRPCGCRAVFFDVGGTLIEPWPSVGAIYARVAARHGIRAVAADIDRGFREAWRRQPPVAGLTVSQKEWWRQLNRQVVAGATDDYFDDLYAVFEQTDVWRVYDDVAGALAQARAAGRHVGVISNWDERLRPLLKRLGLDGFDSITVSCEVGAEKPAGEIFQAALRAAGVDAAEALHIGDSVAEDVRGAEAAGLRAAWIDRAAGSLEELVDRELREAGH